MLGLIPNSSAFAWFLPPLRREFMQPANPNEERYDEGVIHFLSLFPVISMG